MLINQNLLTFATCSKDGQPHAVIIEPSRFEKERIIIPVVQMETSKRNVKENPYVFLHCFIQKGLEDSIQLKISADAEIYESGELFEEIKEFEGKRLPEGLFVNAIFVVYPTKIEEFIG